MKKNNCRGLIRPEIYVLEKQSISENLKTLDGNAGNTGTKKSRTGIPVLQIPVYRY